MTAKTTETGPKGTGKQAAPGLKDHAAAFWTGFTEQSRTAFYAMAATAAAMLAAAIWFFSPATLAGPAGAFAARSSLDAEAFATVEAVRLAATPQERPRLLFLGSSMIAQAIGRPDRLEEALDARPETAEWEAHMLTTPLQTHLDQLTLIETALGGRRDGDPPVVIAIGVGVQRLALDPERIAGLERSGRLGVRSDWADEELAESGGTPRARFGLAALDNFHFVVNNGPVVLLRMLSLRPATRHLASYARGEAVPAEARPRDLTLRQIRKGQAIGGEAGDEGYMDVLARLDRRLDALSGVYIVLVDERLSPDMLAYEDLREVSARAYRDFAAQAAAFGGAFIPMMRDADLAGGDYHDDYHIKIGAPQDRVRAAFAAAFADFVDDAGLGGR